MNIAESVIQYIIDLGFATALNDDIFIGGISQNAPNASWWVITSGGNPVSKNATGEKVKNYLVDIFYRNTDPQDVNNQMQDLEIELNKSACINLTDFDTIEVEAIVFPNDQDIDLQDRTIGTLRLSAITYYKEA